MEETVVVRKQNRAYYAADIKPGTFRNVDILKLYNNSETG